MRTPRAFRFVTSSAVLLAFAGFAPARPVASQAALPDAQAIVKRHVAALGGEAAFKSVKWMHGRGRLSMPAQQMTGEIELLAARPAKLLNRETIVGIGKLENGYNGTVGWIVDTSGPELLSGRALSEAADDAWFDAPLHLPDRVRQMTTVAKTDFDGRPAYKVKLVLKSGAEQMEYFDVDTGMQIGLEASRAMPLGAVDVTSVFRDFKKIGPIMQAMTLVQRAAGFEQIATLTSIDYDPLPDSAFDPPPAVKALVRP